MDKLILEHHLKAEDLWKDFPTGDYFDYRWGNTYSVPIHNYSEYREYVEPRRKSPLSLQQLCAQHLIYNRPDLVKAAADGEIALPHTCTLCSACLHIDGLLYIDSRELYKPSWGSFDVDSVYCPGDGYGPLRVTRSRVEEILRTWDTRISQLLEPLRVYQAKQEEKLLARRKKEESNNEHGLEEESSDEDDSVEESDEGHGCLTSNMLESPGSFEAALLRPGASPSWYNDQGPLGHALKQTVFAVGDRFKKDWEIVAMKESIVLLRFCRKWMDDPRDILFVVRP